MLPVMKQKIPQTDFCFARLSRAVPRYEQRSIQMAAGYRCHEHDPA